MLATTGSLPGREADWAFEIKWDGVRALCYVADGELRMESRNLLDITPRYPELAGLATTPALARRNAILDGEVVAFDADGRPSFGLLQSRMHLANQADVRQRMVDTPVVLMLFDLLWLDGESLMGLPWTERRAALDGLALDDPAFRISTAWPGEGAGLVAASRERGLEGVMAKRMDSVYEPGRRSRCWLKIKNVNRQEMVIGGWLPGEGNRTGRLGALLIGYYEGDDLRFAGKVGTGFNDKTLQEMAERLAPLARDTSPFADKVPWKQARYVQPELVADVEFTEWTGNGTLRHPSYKGLRADKSPREVVREPLSGRQ
ncbi:MAG: bifunctional non-ous end joining protein LigD [Acidimicrobiaceae bacterium]|nr:bifunctional non-ous end joining protein LigD [Acidimicrobiaceae bacterium]